MVDYTLIGECNAKSEKCSRWTVLAILLLTITLGLCFIVGMTYVFYLKYEKNNSCHSRNEPVENRSLTSFMLFSDIHLDPWYTPVAGKDSFCRNASKPSTYNAPLGRIGCDSPISLLEETLRVMTEHAQELTHIDFIMMSGDSCAHRININRRAEILAILNITTSAVQSAFPNIPYFPSIGNNDLPGHYVMPGENDTWYSDVLNIWQDAILCSYCNVKKNTTDVDQLRQTFLYGGYYRVSIADGKILLLVLNSMYWTKSTWKHDKYFQERANEQLKWIEMQLNYARRTGLKIIITSHIAPGIDSYSGKSLWLSNYTEIYMNLIANDFSDIVIGQIYAHFHKDDFRFLQKNTDNLSLRNSSYILLIPAVTPVYKNNPSFRIVHLDSNVLAISDYEQWYMNLVMATEFDNPVWQLDYKFSSRYPAKGDDDNVINGKRIKHLSDNIINQFNDSYFNGFIASRQVHYQPDPFSRFEYYCAITFYSQEEFDVCRKKYLVPGG